MQLSLTFILRITRITKWINALLVNNLSIYALLVLSKLFSCLLLDFPHSFFWHNSRRQIRNLAILKNQQLKAVKGASKRVSLLKILRNISKQLFLELLWMFTSGSSSWLNVLVLVKSVTKIQHFSGLSGLFTNRFFFQCFYKLCKLYKSKGCSLKFSLEDTANHNYKFKGTRKSVVECKKHTLNLRGVYLFCSFSVIF